VAMLALAAGGVLAVSGLAGTGDAGGMPAAAAFRLADGSVACDYAHGRVACSAAGQDEAIVLEPDGSSHAGAVSEVGWDESTPVLLPGESWWNGDLSCLAAEAEVTCTAGDAELHVTATGAGGASSAAADAG
jgi:hypothetical protein